MSTIAERLVTLRGAKSRRSFADEIGTKESTLRNYEQGVTQPSADFLEIICKKMRITPQWLLLGEGGMIPNESQLVDESVADLKRRIAELEKQLAESQADTIKAYKLAVEAMKPTVNTFQEESQPYQNLPNKTDTITKTPHNNMKYTD